MSAPTTEALTALARDIDALVRSGEEPKAAMQRAQRVLQAALARDPDLLPEIYRVPVTGQDTTAYLVHKPADGAFSMLSVVWQPGGITAIHDHLIWGVSGQIEGTLLEQTFKCRNDRNTVEFADLREGKVITASEGSVTWVIPPEDIHQVRNPGAARAVALQIYGADFGEVRRHKFDSATGKVLPNRTIYDRLGAAA